MTNGKLRLRYSKTGKAKYISHLDLMATMRRAMRRAGLELKYSEGFNPHPYISVALPLPVGSSSVCELMDIGIVGNAQPDDLPGLINATLPKGIEVLEAYAPEHKFNGIAWVEIRSVLHYDAGATACIAERLKERFDAQRIVISKKTKRGEADIDIAPFIRDIAFSLDGEIYPRAKVFAGNPPRIFDDRRCGKTAGMLAAFQGSTAPYGGKKTGAGLQMLSLSGITMAAKLSAQDPSITAENLVSALKGGPETLAPDFYDSTRIEVYDKDMMAFR